MILEILFKMYENLVNTICHIEEIFLSNEKDMAEICLKEL